MLRLRSAEPPFAEPEVAGQAARLLALVEAVGIWQPSTIVEVLDRDVFTAVLGALADAEVGIGGPVMWETYATKSVDAFASWIRSVRDSIAASPVPELELPKLDALFGTDRLSGLIGAAESSLRRYLAHAHVTPDPVAGRGHFLAVVAGNLAGSYNDRGIRRWFERPRSELGGRRPEEILRGEWDPDAPEVAELASLSAELVG